jgi:hypothetical protein
VKAASRFIDEGGPRRPSTAGRDEDFQGFYGLGRGLDVLGENNLTKQRAGPRSSSGVDDTIRGLDGVL